MKKTLLWLLFLISISTTYFIGCIPSKPTEDVELLPSERLINRLEANRRKIYNFEGSGTLQVKSTSLNNSASFRVVMQKPDSIYLAVMGPFGIELAEAVVTKENFIFYDVINNTAYEGKIDEDVLREIFKIDLSFNEMMDAFIGAVNLTSHLYKPPTNYEVIYDEYILTYKDLPTNTTAIYNVDVRQLGITEYRLLRDDEEILTGKYSDFKILENVAVPYKIEIRNKLQNQTITINYKKMAVNSEQIFIDFQLPDDVTIIKW